MPLNPVLDRPEDARLLSYPTGEAIEEGDRVRFDRTIGRVELMVDGPGDKATEPYFQEFGPGVLVGESVAFGRVFVPLPQELARLSFIGRGDPRKALKSGGAMRLSHKQVRIVRQILGIAFLAFVAYWMFAFVAVNLMFKKWW